MPLWVVKICLTSEWYIRWYIRIFCWILALNDTSSSLDTSFSPKRPRKAPDLREVIPDIRYDKHEHWPIHREDRPRCFQGKEKTRLGCSKCEKGLCLTKDRNCFTNFHDVFDC